MRTLAVLALVAFCACAAPGAARADERGDLITRIVEAHASDTNPALAPMVRDLATAMGAARANLTPEETRQLEAGLTRTLVQTMRDLFSPALNDPQKFSIEELRQIAAFVTSSTGQKWNGAVMNIDVSSPEAKSKVVASLLRNIEPALLVKLMAAPPRNSAN